MPRQIQLPRVISVQASAAQTSSSNSGNLKNTANAIPIGDAVTLILDVTSLTGVTGAATLHVYIDSSVDGGTTWYPSIHFAEVAASTNIQRLELRTIGLGPTESASLYNMGAAITVTSVTTINTVLAVDHRVRWTPNGSGAAATFAVWAITQPFGTYAA